MTRPYSHHVKTAQGPGLLGAPTRTPKPDGSQLAMGRPDEQGVSRPVPPPAPYTGWQRSQAPDPEVQQMELRKGYGPWSNWQVYTPRKSFERNYGPELTEKLRQNAMAYQEANPQAMAEYGASTLMPDYSRKYFDASQWVRQGDSPDPVEAWAGRPMPIISSIGEIFLPAVNMDVGTERHGTFDNPTPYYNSVLQHEFTHRLQPQMRWSQGGGSQRLMSGDDPSKALGSQREYIASSERALPYSRFPAELAPQVSQAKLEYFNHLKEMSKDREWYNDPKFEPNVPVMETYDPANPEEWWGRVAAMARRQGGIFSEGVRGGMSPEAARRAVLDERGTLNHGSMIDGRQASIDRSNRRAQEFYAREMAFINDLRERLADNPADPGEAMNFNDPRNYQLFLDYMGSEGKGRDSEDVDWILRLSPEERDLYFKGIVSSQPYSEYRA